MELLQTSPSSRVRFVKAFKGLFSKELPIHTDPLPPAFDNLPPETDLIVHNLEQPALSLLNYDSSVLEKLLFGTEDRNIDDIK